MGLLPNTGTDTLLVLEVGTSQGTPVPPPQSALARPRTRMKRSKHILPPTEPPGSPRARRTLNEPHSPRGRRALLHSAPCRPSFRRPLPCNPSSLSILLSSLSLAPALDRAPSFPSPATLAGRDIPSMLSCDLSSSVKPKIKRRPPPPCVPSRVRTPRFRDRLNLTVLTVLTRLASKPVNTDGVARSIDKTLCFHHHDLFHNGGCTIHHFFPPAVCGQTFHHRILVAYVGIMHASRRSQ